MKNLITAVRRMEAEQTRERQKADTPEAFRSKFAKLYGPGSVKGAENRAGDAGNGAGERREGQTGEEPPQDAGAPQGAEAGNTPPPPKAGAKNRGSKPRSRKAKK